MQHACSRSRSFIFSFHFILFTLELPASTTAFDGSLTQREIPFPPHVLGLHARTSSSINCIANGQVTTTSSGRVITWWRTCNTNQPLHPSIQWCLYRNVILLYIYILILGYIIAEKKDRVCFFLLLSWTCCRILSQCVLSCYKVRMILMMIIRISLLILIATRIYVFFVVKAFVHLIGSAAVGSRLLIVDQSTLYAGS